MRNYLIGHQSCDDTREGQLYNRPLTPTDIVLDGTTLRRSSGSRGTMITSNKNPTGLESGKSKLLVAISQIGSVQAKQTQSEFSDDEDVWQPPETSANWRIFLKAKASQAWSSDFSTHARAETWRALTGLKRWTADLCDEAKQNLWDTRNESERRTIVGSILLLFLLPFFLPMLTNYMQIFSEQSRTVFLCVPELLSGDSAEFFDVSKIGIPFRSSSPSSASQNTIQLQTVVDKLISDPKFLDLVKPDESHQIVLEKKFSDLMNKMKTDFEANNLNLSSDLEKLRLNIKSQLDRVVGNFPILSSEVETLTASSSRIRQNVEAKLANLYLELEAARREITNLRMTNTRFAEKSGEESRKVSQLEQQLNGLVADNCALSSQVRDCQIKSENLDQDVNSIVQDMITRFDAAQNVTWSNKVESLLSDDRAQYLMDDQLDDRMETMTQRLRRDFARNVDANLEEQVETSLSKKIEDLFENSVRKKISDFASNSFFKDDVEKIVQEALSAYDADKTGRFDFALESSGGTIVGTPSTETYEPTRAIFSVWGIPIWQVKNSPRQIIESGSNPGQCWAFKGSQGRVIIKLSDEIQISDVTLEHIPHTLSPDGTISSAPKNFEIFGLSSKAEQNPDRLGNFTYDASGWPVQVFHLSQSSDVRYNYLELKVLSNHGNPVYTCIYRFRVHGNK